MDSTSRNKKFPEHLAKAIVQKISKQVKGLLQGTRIEDSKLHEKRSDEETLELFDKNDLKLGKLLGVGGFSDVYEILNFSSTTSTREEWTRPQRMARGKFKETAFERNGNSKYVIKHLKAKMMKDPNKFCMAASDLAVEAQILNSLDHENILKLRGWANGGIRSYSNGNHDDYFLILDRLYDTLDNKIASWRKKEKKDLVSLNSSKKMIYDKYILSRGVNVAYQIASALKYLHSQNIVFRDLKPNNVGFDKYGIVKLFDFGLARELPKECTDMNDVYHMSGMVGTLRYMAPEVAFSKHYNQKIDTYSWATVFWSCLSLTIPYPNTKRSEYLKNVCKLGERPPMKDKWPESICNLLEKTWAQNSYDRLTMKEVCSELEQIELELRLEANTMKKFKPNSSSFVVPASLIRDTSNSLVSCS